MPDKLEKSEWPGSVRTNRLRYFFATVDSRRESVQQQEAKLR
jgi:hypothetical protein